MPELIVCEEHHQVYDTWCERGLSGLRVAHVDFHCDMRGLVINRRRQVAYFPGSAEVPRRDSGNFLGVALMEGRVSAVSWIHARHGGRRYDAGTVKYERDLSALRHRIGRRRQLESERSIVFQEMTFDAWDGVCPGEHLDIDWDGLASIDYADTYARCLIEGFLGRAFAVIPATTFLVYSPGYSNPDRALFEEFVERLSAKFAARVTRLPAPELPLGLPRPPQDLPYALRLKHRLVVGLHRVGVH